MELPNRKRIRLQNFDYNENGAYFVTVCVKDRKQILSNINVGTGVLDCSKIVLTKCGEIVDRYINQLNAFYDNISVDKYVVMLDHIHLLIMVSNNLRGRSGMPVPTDADYKIDNTNSIISKFVSTFKRFCNKEIGEPIFQRSYYNHVIRNQSDYNDTWEYIESNPSRWVEKHECIVVKD